HEADVALLDQIVEADGAAALLASDRDDEREIVADQLLLCGDVAFTSADGEGVFVLSRERRKVAHGLEVGRELLEFSAAALRGCSPHLLTFSYSATICGGDRGGRLRNVSLESWTCRVNHALRGREALRTFPVRGFAHTSGPAGVSREYVTSGGL